MFLTNVEFCARVSASIHNINFYSEWQTQITKNVAFHAHSYINCEDKSSLNLFPEKGS